MIIKHCVGDNLLNMKLTDMRCKHGICTNSRGREVIRLSKQTGYDWSEWGSHSGHTDIRYHADVIMKMEADKYEHAERIVICKYGFYDRPCIWIDNLHSAVMYVRKHGLDARLLDIPFYIVDISGREPVISENGYGVISQDTERMEGAIMSARKRKKWSESKELIELNYTFGEFLADNPLLLTCHKSFGTEGIMRGKKIK